MDDEIGPVKAPRLCQMKKEEAGYGFNLHGEKGVIGQYISAVDPGGPADNSGMCVGDRVVEVNGENVEHLSHADVVARIRSRPDSTTLLVIDKITDSYLKKIGRSVTADLVGYSSMHEVKSTADENRVNNTESNFSKMSIQNHENKTNGIDDVDSIPLRGKEAIEEKDTLVKQTTISSPPQKIMPIQPVKPPRPDLTQTPSKVTPVKPPRTSPTNSPESSPKKSPKDSSQTSKNPERPSRPAPLLSPEPAENEKKEHLENTSVLPTSPLHARPMSMPKRKQVKQTKADWKSKQSLFDQL